MGEIDVNVVIDEENKEEPYTISYETNQQIESMPDFKNRLNLYVKELYEDCLFNRRVSIKEILDSQPVLF
jgi:hypothetical protein